MAGIQGDDIPAHQGVLSGGFGHVAGRDTPPPEVSASVSESHGVQVGERSVQVNNFYMGGGNAVQHVPAALAGAAGRVLEDVTDPFALEVHRPVQVSGLPPGLGALPTYVPRDHDGALDGVVRAAAQGKSGLVVLVGGSSTGKTRACWEALELLRGQLEPWRLWHPIAPSRPEAALRELPLVGPRTVVWLNEAQFYLGAADGLGERIAAGLRETLQDPARAPVLVLATLWPDHWDTLSVGPLPTATDPHPQARELLAGRDVSVPAAFTFGQLRQVPAASDPRLAVALEAAEDRQVTQFLAGAPELMARYRNAPPAVEALISAAMDARRLGMGIALPVAFLEHAAPGYLTDAQWDGLAENWLGQALAYAAAPAKGVRGPLTEIRPRPGNEATGPAYRLADYLEQHGRQARRDCILPPQFWTAIALHAGRADLPALANAAQCRGQLRAAARLRKTAAELGNTSEAAVLIRDLHTLHPADPRPARWVADHASVDNPHDVGRLLDALQEVGAREQATALAARTLAHAPLDDPYAVASLLTALQELGADEQVAALAARDPAAHAPLDHPYGVASLLAALQKVGTHEQATGLAARAAARFSLDKPYDVASVKDELFRTFWGQALTASIHYPLHVPDLPAVDPLTVAAKKLGQYSMLRLRYLWYWKDTDKQVTALATHDPARASLDDPYAVANLLCDLQELGADEQVAALVARDPAAHAPLDDPYGVASLLYALWKAGADEQVAALAARDPAAHAPLNDPSGVASLLTALQEAGVDGQVAALVARDPAAHAPLDDPHGVASLLYALWKAGAEEQVAALAARDPAAHTPLDDPRAVARLLEVLDDVRADEQGAALAARAAACAPLGDLDAVASLLRALRRPGGADEQAAVLAARAAAEAPLDNPSAVARLLKDLRHWEWMTELNNTAALNLGSLLGPIFKARAQEQHTGPATYVPLDAASRRNALRARNYRLRRTFIDRLPAAGQFGLFLQESGRENEYRFGCTSEGSPASPWGWKDIS
jgi:hypothetical protein